MNKSSPTRPTASQPDPAWRRPLGVGLLACGLLVTELTMMRLFSVVLVYHYAFLVLSLTLLGLGSGGIFHFVWDVFRRRPQSLPWLGLAAALSIPLCLAAVLRLRLNPYDLSSTSVLAIVAIVLVSVLPYGLVGLYLSLIYFRFQSQVSRLYAADLGGAAAGCLVATALFDALGAPALPWLGAGLMLLSARQFVEPGASSRLRPALMLAGVLLVGGWTAGVTELQYVKGRTESNIEFQKWNAFSRIAVVDMGDRKGIQIDADASTEILPSQWLEANGDQLLEQITGIAYQVHSEGDALVVGPGGGRDIATALQAGMSRVTGVEINPIIVNDVMKGSYLDYSGRIYVRPGVDVVVDDARHFLDRTSLEFDVIQATAVDTWAALAGGGLTLSESYLYTVEAFRQYLAHLNPGGVLAIGRWVFDPPQQMIRVLVLALEVLEEAGAGSPGHHIFVAGDPSFDVEGVVPGVILIKKDPFSQSELERLNTFCERNGFDVLYSPATEGSNAFYDLVEAPSRPAFLSQYPYRVEPVTDDKPFFFLTARWSEVASLLGAPTESKKNNFGLFVLLVLLGVVSVLTVLFLVLPLVLNRTEWIGTGPAFYFVGIGLGFMMLEMVFIQKAILFLGHPSLAFVTVVFYLLSASGIGSLRSGRISIGHIASTQRLVLGLLTAALLLTGLLLTPWLEWGAGLPRWVRFLWLGVPLLPLGFLLGHLFPLGLRRVSGANVPWAWGLNGAASVLGSNSAILLAMIAGFQNVLWVILAVYAMVALATVSTSDRPIT